MHVTAPQLNTSFFFKVEVGRACDRSSVEYKFFFKVEVGRACDRSSAMWCLTRAKVSE